jgi:polysaccharide pyruvyl transferase WcaK-like protein
LIIEIHGAGFVNKGAELMLRTVVAELSSRLPGFQPAIDPLYGPYDARCELGLHQLFPPRSHVGTTRFSRRFRRQRLFAAVVGSRIFRRVVGASLADYGCAPLSHMQGLVDIAGYAYTDQWGARPTQDLAELTQYYKSGGRPVILLPQALGPFRETETRLAFGRVVRNSSLIFARDRQSYEHVKELAPEATHVLQAPDITLFGQASLPGAASDRSDYACVIPNVRLLDQGGQQWGDTYEASLARMAETILGRGVDARVVVYDRSGEDLRLAQRLVETLDSPAASVVDEPDPVALGQVVRGSLIVVGSRYHGLVAALSGGVPVVALGWAHKYEMLLDEFGCPEFAISSETPVGEAVAAVEQLLDENVNKSHRARIKRRLAAMSRVNRRMWELVLDVLESAQAA